MIPFFSFSEEAQSQRSRALSHAAMSKSSQELRDLQIELAQAKESKNFTICKSLAVKISAVQQRIEELTDLMRELDAAIACEDFEKCEELQKLVTVLENFNPKEHHKRGEQLFGFGGEWQPADNAQAVKCFRRAADAGYGNTYARLKCARH
jgi:hypothetical protein